MYIRSNRNAILSLEISLYIRLGCSGWERKTLQEVELQVSFSFESKRSDNLSDTINYSFLRAELLNFLERSEYYLLETLCEEVIDFVFRWHPSIKECWISGKKVVQKVTCHIRKSREEFAD